MPHVRYAYKRFYINIYSVHILGKLTCAYMCPWHMKEVRIIKNITPEHEIQNKIRVAVSQHGCTIFRANVGKVKLPNGRIFDTGLPKGYPDLFGFRHSDGKMFFIEVKNEIGRLRPEQITFQRFASRMPVLYGVARSPEDAIKIVSDEDDA